MNVPPILVVRDADEEPAPQAHSTRGISVSMARKTGSSEAPASMAVAAARSVAARVASLENPLLSRTIPANSAVAILESSGAASSGSSPMTTSQLAAGFGVDQVDRPEPRVCDVVIDAHDHRACQPVLAGALEHHRADPLESRRVTDHSDAGRERWTVRDREASGEHGIRVGEGLRDDLDRASVVPRGERYGHRGADGVAVGILVAERRDGQPALKQIPQPSRFELPTPVTCCVLVLRSGHSLSSGPELSAGNHSDRREEQAR